ncbi:hypothetical protein K2Q00_01725 [Patescibacteria group bacterium]|nr:hypothetical protein [Patescibacteria group bacterium]
MTSTVDNGTTTTPAPQAQPKKEMTGTDRLKEMFPRGTTELPPYVGGSYVNPNILAAKKAEDEKKRKESQGKAKVGQSTLPLRPLALDGVRSAPKPSQWNHSAIQTRFPIPGTLSSTTEANITGNPPLAHLNPQHIVEASASLLGLKMEDLLSNQRMSRISGPRQVIIYFVLRNTGCNLPTIAKLINFHHTSCLYANRKLSSVLRYGVTRSSKQAGELEKRQLVELRTLCKHYKVELPPSEHWPPEEPEAEVQNVPQRTAAD